MHFHGDPFHLCLLSQPYKSLASISVVPSFFFFHLSIGLAANHSRLKHFLFSPSSSQKFIQFLITHRYKGVKFFNRPK